MQRIALRRHLHFAFCIRRGDFEQIGLFRLTGDDGMAFLATSQQLGKVGHHIITFGFGRLMATGTIGLENGADVLVKRDWLVRINALFFLWGCRMKGQRQE